MINALITGAHYISTEADDNFIFHCCGNAVCMHPSARSVIVCTYWEVLEMDIVSDVY